MVKMPPITAPQIPDLSPARCTCMEHLLVLRSGPKPTTISLGLAPSEHDTSSTSRSAQLHRQAGLRTRSACCGVDKGVMNIRGWPTSQATALAVLGLGILGRVRHGPFRLLKLDAENIHTPTMRLKRAACLRLIGTTMIHSGRPGRSAPAMVSH